MRFGDLTAVCWTCAACDVSNPSSCLMALDQNCLTQEVPFGQLHCQDVSWSCLDAGFKTAAKEVQMGLVPNDLASP